MTLSAHRLHPNDPNGWRLFPSLEARVRSMLGRYSPDIPVEVYVQALRTRFLATPDLTYLLVVMQEDGRAVAHLVAWIDVAWGQPIAHVNQVEADDGVSVRMIMPPVLQGIGAWVQSLNAKYQEQGNTTRIRHCEFWTPWRPEIWQRYMQSVVEPKTVLHVLRWDIDGIQHGSALEREN